MYWDLLKVDLFLCQMLDLIFGNYRFSGPFWNVLCLGVFGMRWCMFVNKGGQGSVILFVESIDLLRWIIN